MSAIPAQTRQSSRMVTYPPQDSIGDLLKLHRAAQTITSILELDPLIDSIVNEVARIFGCSEVNIFLRHPVREEMVLAGVHGCTIHGKGEVLRVGQQGIVGHAAFTGQSYYAPDVRNDPYYVACEEDTLSEVGIPLRSNGKVIGVFAASHCHVDGFSPSHLQLLERLAEHIAIAIENARVFGEQRKENQRLTRDADEAREMQQALLPKASLLFPDVYVSGASLPAGAVGGDWYDYIDLENGKWGIVLADVSGKGMAAAMLMSATRALLRSVAETIESPGEVLSRLNRILLCDFPAGRFITMVYAVLDPVARKLTFATAGHPWPLLVKENSFEFLETETGLPLGVAETTFTERTIALPAGSRLLFYSDGIVEASIDNGEEFGTDRLAYSAASLSVSTDRILEDVERFAAGDVSDDATVVLIAGR
jgi:sigma-B regulation protein RsbU (phosphoserine phosphatase)